MITNRRTHLAGLAALGLSGLAPAQAEGPGPFAGLWSAVFLDDETGLASRVRLDIAPDGKVTVTFVDLANVPWPASSVGFDPPSIVIEWNAIGLAFTGRLAGPDTIVGRPTGAAIDKPKDQTFSRGDRFVVDATVLPHGLMDPDRLHRLRQISGAPALGVAWAFKNQADHVLTDGLRSSEADVAVSPTDRWHIGSCTKSMTATLAARLVSAGRLQWTTTIGEVLGPVVRDIHPAYREANLLHLFSHHAGLMRDPPGANTFSHGKRVAVHAERVLYAERLLREPPLGPIGTTNIYSNGGFVVAGLMLEVIAGQLYENLMQEQVFAPLGLASAGFGPPAADHGRSSALGHGRGADGTLHPVTAIKLAENPPPCANPCGGVHIGLGDYLTYLKAHRDHPASFLPEAAWKTLQIPPFGGPTALGWGVGPDGTLQHAGSNGLWWAQVSINPWGVVFAGVQNATTPSAISVMAQAQDAIARSWD